MIDVKEEKGLGGDANWPAVPMVHIEGIPEEGDVIEDWANIVVLQLSADVLCYYFWKSGPWSKRLRVPVELDNEFRFGVRLGSGDLDCGVIPVNVNETVELTHVTTTFYGDPAFPHLPVY